MTETEIDSKEWKKRQDRYWKITLAYGVVGWAMVLVLIYQVGFLVGQLSVKAAAGL